MFKEPPRSGIMKNCRAFVVANVSLRAMLQQQLCRRYVVPGSRFVKGSCAIVCGNVHFNILTSKKLFETISCIAGSK